MVKKDDYTQHISAQFNAELEDISSNFLTMGGMVEKQVVDAIQSLLDADSNLAEKVQAADKQINQMERQIDEELVRILARRQPAASDLRFIIAIGKSITDLERIGDEAAKVARYALALTEEGESPRGYTESRHIGNQVRVMVHDALDAFARFDAELAFRVMQDDNVIDSEYKTALRALMTYMMEDPRNITACTHLLFCAKNLERIGDHVTNIAENAYYVLTGEQLPVNRPKSDETLSVPAG